MTHDDDFVFIQVLAQVLRKLNAILHHSFHRDSRRHCGSSFSQGSARASLIPLHHGKMLRPWCEHRECPGVGDVARAAMQEQQHGVVTIPAANCDPLFDTADCDELRLVDALRRRNSVLLRVTGSQRAKSSNLRYSESMPGGAGGGCWPLATCPNVPRDRQKSE